MFRLDQHIRNAGDSDEIYGKSREIYLLSGDIVLLCKSVAFRVHEGYMINKSPLLKSMLEVSRRNHPRLYFDNCLAIKAPGNITPLTTLLKAFYMPSFRKEFFNSANGVELVELTRISFDYGVKCIFNRCYRRLEYFYPTRLELWDQVQGPRPDPGLVVGLSRYINKPIFLPSAFYYLTTASTFYTLCQEDLQIYWLVRLGLQEFWSRFLEQEKQNLPMYDDLIGREEALHPRHAIDPLFQLLEYIRVVYNYQKSPFPDRFRTIHRALGRRSFLWNVLSKFIRKRCGNQYKLYTFGNWNRTRHTPSTPALTLN